MHVHVHTTPAPPCFQDTNDIEATRSTHACKYSTAPYKTKSQGQAKLQLPCASCMWSMIWPGLLRVTENMSGCAMSGHKAGDTALVLTVLHGITAMPPAQLALPFLYGKCCNDDFSSITKCSIEEAAQCVISVHGQLLCYHTQALQGSRQGSTRQHQAHNLGACAAAGSRV